jgi:UDP:flavonoid glycosyltransferase YjiC (YdhE family)
MAVILMATWDGAGNFPPQRALMRELVDRGHRVHVLAHDVQRPAVEAAGATFIGYADVTQVDCAAPGIDDIVFDAVMLADGIGASFSGAVDRLKPDILLLDEFLVKAFEVAERSGIPTVALGSTLHGFIRGTPLQAASEACRLILKFSYLEFERSEDAPPNAAYVGPLRPADGDATPFRQRWPERPLVIASLSTSHQGQEALLQRLCDVLGDLELEALVTTGRGVDPASLTAKANTTVVRHAAHDAVLPTARLLITHAGHGTVMAGASYGVPMLCLPMGRDQPRVAARVADLGLGTVLDPAAPSPELAAAVTDLLSDPAMKARSQAFARKVAGRRNPAHAADLLEGMLIKA